jgi:hypothetical protein
LYCICEFTLKFVPTLLHLGNRRVSLSGTMSGFTQARSHRTSGYAEERGYEVCLPTHALAG